MTTILVGELLHEPSWGVLQIVCFGSGIAIAIFFRWIEKVTPTEQEAVIGSTFILAASASLLLLADDPHGGDELAHVLSGELLFVTWLDILTFLPIFVIVGLLWVIVPSLRKGIGFYVLFAFTVTASVQLVGVYVVFASLILPALAARSGPDYKLRRALICGGLAVLAAILVSALSDLPSGPFLVVCFAVFALLTRLLFLRENTHNSTE